MGTVTQITRANYSIGDLVCHRLFDYRGVIVDIDPNFQSTDEWYEAMAKTNPPKDKPWYHVLVHGGSHTTYVAENNIVADDSGDPIEHPMVEQFFSKFEDGHYTSIDQTN